MSMPNAHHAPSTHLAQSRYAVLQHRSQKFCSAFLDLSNNPPEKLLEDHFSRENPRITEHGPAWASKRLPFLGKTFSGREGCIEYFRLLGETLKFLPNEETFPALEGFVVDDRSSAGGEERHGGSGRGWDGRGAVSVVGKAKFRAVGTGREWEEQFIYRLSDFDEEGRIGHWEVWADALSAWVAVGGDGKEVVVGR